MCTQGWEPIYAVEDSNASQVLKDTKRQGGLARGLDWEYGAPQEPMWKERGGVPVEGTMGSWLGSGASHWGDSVRAVSQLPGAEEQGPLHFPVLSTGKTTVWVFPWELWPKEAQSLGKIRPLAYADSTPFSSRWLLFSCLSSALDLRKYENASRGGYNLNLRTHPKISSPGGGWRGSPKPCCGHCLLCPEW